MAIIAHGMYEKTIQNVYVSCNLNFEKESNTIHNWYIIPDKYKQIDKNSFTVTCYINDENIAPYNKYFAPRISHTNFGHLGYLVIKLQIPDSNFSYIIKIEMIDEIFYKNLYAI